MQMEVLTTIKTYINQLLFYFFLWETF